MSTHIHTRNCWDEGGTNLTCTLDLQPQLGTCPECGAAAPCHYSWCSTKPIGNVPEAAPQARPAPPPSCGKADERAAAFQKEFTQIPKWKQLGINLFARENRFIYESWFNAGYVAGEAQGEAALLAQDRARLRDYECNIGRILAHAMQYLNDQSPKNWQAVELLNQAWGEGFREYVYGTRVDAGAHPAPEQDDDEQLYAIVKSAFTEIENDPPEAAFWAVKQAIKWWKAEAYRLENTIRLLRTELGHIGQARAAHPESRGAAPIPHSSVVHTDLTVRCHGCGGTVIWRYFEEKDEIEIFHGPNCAAPPSSPGAPLQCPRCHSERREELSYECSAEGILPDKWHSPFGSPGAETEKK